MNRNAMIACLAAILAALAAWTAWLWYNKDRYQYVPDVGVKYSSSLIFDKNTGKVVR